MAGLVGICGPCFRCCGSGEWAEQAWGVPCAGGDPCQPTESPAMFLTLALAPPPPSVSARASRAMLLFLENDQPMLLLIVREGGS